MKNNITQAELRECLNYDKETGEFSWKKKTNRRIVVGSKAGVIRTDNGYVVIGFNGVDYLAHRLAWIYEHGDIDCQIDHKNHIRHDNRIANLRQCSVTENRRNSSLSSRNTSGHKGVSFCKRDNKWRSYIKIDKKVKSLGYFDNKEMAQAAYKAAALAIFGDFAYVI